MVPRTLQRTLIPFKLALSLGFLCFYMCGSGICGVESLESPSSSRSRKASPCDKWDACSQKCDEGVNGENFTCSCLDEFHLGEDNRTCLPNDSKVQIAFALSNSIKIMDIETKKQFTIVEKKGQTVGVAVDVKGGYVFWTDVSEGNEAVYRAKVNGKGGIETIVDTGLLLPEGIAFDWVTGNIYIADSNRSHIVVCQGDGRMCSVLIRLFMMDKPREVALHPSQGLMFWTDWGEKSSIMRAAMDGSAAVAIITEDIKWPNSLAVDNGRNRLYWTDALYDRIETSRLTGEDRQLVNMERVNHPFSLEVFGDLVFWSDWDLKEIQSCTKFSCKSNISTVVNAGVPPNGIAVFHPAAQPNVRANPCKSQCSHICVLSGKTSYSCKCSAGFKLDKAKKNCIDDDTKPKILIGHNNTLKVLRFDSIGRDVDIVEETKIPDLKNIGAIAYNAVNDSVFISDLTWKAIYEYSLSRRVLKTISNTHLDSIKSMSLDPVGENLYWVDSIRRKVEVMSCRTGAKAIIAMEADHPQSIIVVPEERYLFVALTGTRGGRILRMNMNGYNRRTLIRTSRGEPTSLTYNAELKRIFWIDRFRDSIEHVSFSGRSQVTAERRDKPYGLTSFGNRIFWTDRHTQMLHTLAVFGIDEKEAPIFIGHLDDKYSNGTVESYIKGNFLAKLTVVHKDNAYDNLTRNHECSARKTTRKCSHICLLSAQLDIGTCVCPEGMELNGDGKTCSWTTACLKTQFQCHDKKCIDADWKCDGSHDCEGGEDEKDCKHVKSCPGESDFLCESDRSCIHAKWRCDGGRDCPNGEDELNCNIHTCAAGSEFQCKNGSCIPITWKCDHQFDCPNGEDEENCNRTCPIGTFQCKQDLECISVDWVCDGEADCRDLSDEHNHCEIACSENSFRCLNHHCIPGFLACDGTYDCSDKSDEFDCDNAPLINTSRSKTSTVKIHRPADRMDTLTSEESRVPADSSREGSSVGWWVFSIFLILILVGGVVAFVLYQKRIHPKVLFERYAHHIPVKFNIRRTQGNRDSLGDDETYQDFSDGRGSSDHAGLLSNIDASI